MIKKIIFFSIFAVAFFMLSAQQANIHLLDLGMVPVMTTGQTPSSDINLKVSFKIDHSDLAQTVFVDFGSTPGGNDIASFTAQVVPDGSGYAISYNGTNYPIGTNYEAGFIVSLTQQQFNNFSYITLKVNDNSGYYSNSLSLNNN